MKPNFNNLKIFLKKIGNMLVVKAPTIITIPYSDKLILAANNMVAIAPPDFRK